MSSQPDSDPVSADQVSSREFSDNAKSRLLMPPPPPPCEICLAIRNLIAFFLLCNVGQAGLEAARGHRFEP